MLLLLYISFGWLIFSIVAENVKQETEVKEIPLLDKFQQNDYKIKFERLELARYDKTHMKSVNVVTFKYNRTCPLVNATHTFNIDVGYKMEIVIQIYKFASNEYRTFPIRFQLNLCDIVFKNIMGIGDFRKCGTFSGCPLVKNKLYKICNWAPNPEMFPPLIPNGQYMMEMQMMFESIELYVMRGYGTVYRPIHIAG